MSQTAEKKVTQEIETVSEQTSLPAQHQPTQLQAQPSQADRLIELAITNKSDPAYLDKLLDLKHRHEAEEARRAFTAALAAFKSEEILIIKDRRVGFDNQSGGRTQYTHASLGNIIEKATPYMSKHGLSHRWEIEQGNGMITVTCILTHCMGHSESTKLTAGADNSGKKNPIQQVASTITYLERYTFTAITGLAVQEQDDDGVAAGALNQKPDRISDKQVADLQAMMDEVLGKNTGSFMSWMRGTLKASKIEDLNENGLKEAIRLLELKRKKS